SPREKSGRASSGPVRVPSAGTRLGVARPFSLPHFRAWARECVLDTGQPWILEDFQEWFVRDLFREYTEAWLIVPEGNTKTTLLGGVALYHSEYRQQAMVPVGASAREQAEWIYRQAEGFVIRTPRLR